MVLPGGNIDCKGVARGKCTECQQCDQFLIKDEDVKCSYCGHPPVSHVNLEQQDLVVQQTEKEFEVELIETTPFPDHLMIEPGTIDVKARLFPGYTDIGATQGVIMAGFFCIMLIVMILFILTFGLIMLILIPIMLVLIIGARFSVGCCNSNPNDLTLTFDNDKQTMTGPVYGTIPYSQISFSAYFKTPATVFFEIRLHDVAYVEKRNCLLKRLTLAIADDDPKYVIMPLNNNAIQLKELVESLAAFTGISYQPPLFSWDSIQMLMSRRIGRYHHRRHSSFNHPSMGFNHPSMHHPSGFNHPSMHHPSAFNRPSMHHPSAFNRPSIHRPSGFHSTYQHGRR